MVSPETEGLMPK